MSLPAIEQKYINLTLSTLYERVLRYKQKIEAGAGNTRDKAIWKALYVDAIRTYNEVLSYLKFVGTNSLAREAKPLTDKYIRELGYEPMMDEDIDYIVGLTFGISKIEREALRYEQQKLNAKALIVGSGSNRKVQVALETLVKHGAIDKLIPLDNLIERQQAIELPNLPRGNPRKAGLVNKYLKEGKTYEQAISLATEAVGEETEEISQTQAEADRRLQEAIALHGGTVEERNRERMAAQNKKDQELLDKLKELDTPKAAGLPPVKTFTIDSVTQNFINTHGDITGDVEEDPLEGFLGKESQ